MSGRAWDSMPRASRVASSVESAARRWIPGDLDQVTVGVAAVDRRHRPERTGALDRSDLDADPADLEVRHDLLGRVLGDEAQVVAARDRVRPGEPGHGVG